MRQEWGREENAGEWPGGRARATLLAFFVAVLAVAGIFYYRYAEEWTPLQRFYLVAICAEWNELREERRIPVARRGEQQREPVGAGRGSGAGCDDGERRAHVRADGGWLTLKLDLICSCFSR